MKKNIIIIPIYNQFPSENELISLRQCKHIFNLKDIVFVAHSNLDCTEYLNAINNAKLVSFDEAYFKNTHTYSKLLLRPEFYKKFMDYEFMLIYQTDSYVFKDDLDYWCSKNFSYIGAPWPSLKWIDTKYPVLSKIKLFKRIFNKVGNGGFSLRKTNDFYKFSKRYNFLLKHTHFQEDIIWSNLPRIFNQDFKIAPFEDAIKFSFDTEAEYLYKLNNCSLPFGCHGWYKYNIDFWKDICV